MTPGLCTPAPVHVPVFERRNDKEWMWMICQSSQADVAARRWAALLYGVKSDFARALESVKPLAVPKMATTSAKSRRDDIDCRRNWMAALALIILIKG